MPDSLEDKLKAVAIEIAGYEVEASKLRQFQSQAFQMKQPFPIEKQLELEEWHRRIAEAQQKQMSYMLASISESSNRLEMATKNLKDTSDAQVAWTETQVEFTQRLLGSSHRLEQFALYLIVLTVLSIFIVEQSQAPTDTLLRTIWFVLSIVAIVALMAVAYLWPRVRKNKLEPD